MTRAGPGMTAKLATLAAPVANAAPAVTAAIA